MYIKHTLSTVLVLACLLAACGPQARIPEDQQPVVAPTGTPEHEQLASTSVVIQEDQQHAVQVILGLAPDEPDIVCELEHGVGCDAQGNIIKLDLSDSQLTSLPPEIGKLVNLQVIELFHNQLTSLPPEIGQLTSLQELYLYDNQLTSLPPEIGKLTNLKRLQLAGNQLTVLPPEIGQLINLQDLNVHGNQLTNLPTEIEQLANLQVLVLGSNPLISLPSELCANLGDAYLNPASLCP